MIEIELLRLVATYSWQTNFNTITWPLTLTQPRLNQEVND